MGFGIKKLTTLDTGCITLYFVKKLKLTLLCVKFIVFWGRARADPGRQDQLVPMGCANTKNVKPWFEPNILFFRGRVRADPRRQDWDPPKI